MKNRGKNSYDILGTEAPQLPESLPRLLHLAVQNAPEHMKPAILNSLFPALGSLMHGVTFRYPALESEKINLSQNPQMHLVLPVCLGSPAGGCYFVVVLRS